MTNNHRLQLFAGAFAAALAAWWYSHLDGAKEYKTEAVQRGRIQSTVSVTGTCSALLTVRVGAQAHVAETTIDEMREARESAVIQETSAEALVRQAEGALEQAKLDLDHTRIASPIDGVVISRQVDAGQTVAASFAAPELFQIAEDLSKMQVDADIDESEVAKVHVGQIAQFTVDTLPARPFQAMVRQVRESATNIQNVVTYDAVMDVANPDLELLPGMTANIRIPVQVRENA